MSKKIKMDKRNPNFYRKRPTQNVILQSAFLNSHMIWTSLSDTTYGIVSPFYTDLTNPSVAGI